MARVMILVALLLSACASPQQRCVNRASYDLRTINSLIRETEANIARGFTYVTEPSPFNNGWAFCTGGGRYGGGILMCQNTGNRTVEVPVAVDVEEQKRKLASLKTKQAELEARTRNAVQACQAGSGASLPY